MPGPVILLANGTRGDVQPYLALARGLRAAGRDVKIAAPHGFRALIEAAGVECAPYAGNPSDLMVRRPEAGALTLGANLARSLAGSLAYARQARALYAPMLDSAWQAVQGAGQLVAGLPTLWGAHLAEALGVPLTWAFLQPLSATRQFPSPLLPGRFSLGGAYNRVSYALVEWAMWLPWRDLIQRFRRQRGLPPASLRPPSRAGQTAAYGFSPRVVPRPADWPAGHQVTGYWFADSPADWRPPPGLESFLAGGPRLGVSFGSPGAAEPAARVELITRALRQAQVRAVLIAPASWQARVDREWIFPLEAAPHAWLYPRLAAVAHHGGAGTTAASLRAGAPTLILPQAIDQFFWGERVAALGAGPAPIPQRALTAEKLARAVRQALDEAPMRQRAQALGQALRAEDGVGRAVRLILDAPTGA